MPIEIIAAIIGGVAIVIAAVIGLVATLIKRKERTNAQSDNHSQTAMGDNITQIQINKDSKK